MLAKPPENKNRPVFLLGFTKKLNRCPFPVFMATAGGSNPRLRPCSCPDRAVHGAGRSSMPAKPANPVFFCSPEHPKSRNSSRSTGSCFQSVALTPAGVPARVRLRATLGSLPAVHGLNPRATSLCASGAKCMNAGSIRGGRDTSMYRAHTRTESAFTIRLSLRITRAVVHDSPLVRSRPLAVCLVSRHLFFSGRQEQRKRAVTPHGVPGRVSGALSKRRPEYRAAFAQEGTASLLGIPAFCSPGTSMCRSFGVLF